MKSSTPTPIRLAILLMATMLPLAGLALPAGYGSFPHLAHTVSAPGDNFDVDGFSIFGGDYFAVCNQNSGLVIYQVTGSSLNQISTYSSPGVEIDFEIRDWTGYLATTGGLGILSLAIPGTPQQQGFVNLPGGDIQALSVSETHAFVACGSEGLAIVDITQPGSMFVAAWYGDEVDAVHADGDRIGVINNGRLELVDVSDPALPVLLGFAASVSVYDYGACAIGGDIAYAHARGQVDHWDFSDPADPQLDPTTPHVFLPYALGGTLKVQSEELQITGHFYLGYLDFASGAILRESAQVWQPRAVDVQAGLRVDSVNDALHVYRDGTLANPVPAGAYDPTGTMNPEGIILGDILYGRSLTGAHTLVAVDLSGDALPLWDYDSGLVSGLRNLAHHGELLAMLSWLPCQLKLVTVSRYGVVERGSLAMENLNPGDQPLAFLDDDYLVVSHAGDWQSPPELRMIDISDPDNPIQVGTYDPGDPTLQEALWTTGNLILLGSRHKVAIIDASDPLDLQPGTTLALGAQSIFVAEGHLYGLRTALHGADLTTWNLTDPANPQVTDELPLPVLIGEFVGCGTYAYQQRTGLILDLAIPGQPTPVGNLSLANPTLNTMDGILASDQYIVTGELAGSSLYPDLHYIPAQGGTGEVSTVEDDLPADARVLKLRASPNPFNPRVSLKFELAARTEILVEVFDVRGRKVASLGSKIREAGVHDLSWDGTSRTGRPLPSGVYFARVRAGDITEAVKVMLAK